MKTTSAYSNSFDKTLFNPIFLKEIFISDETDSAHEDDYFDDYEEIESTMNPSSFNAFIDSEYSEFETI